MITVDAVSYLSNLFTSEFITRDAQGVYLLVKG